MSTDGRVEAGFYKGRAVAGSAQYAMNQANSNEQIAIDIEIPSLGRGFTTFLHFTDAAAPYAIERLRACGWTGDDLTNLEGIDKNEIDVQIKYETYNGKERMKVDIATGGGRIKLDNVMDDKQKRAFAARMKTVLKGGASPAKPRTPAGTTNRSNSGPRDDEWPVGLGDDREPGQEG